MSKHKKTGENVNKKDQCVIYYSREDKCWIAHSLHTDQIGTGKGVLGVLRALVELMTVVDSLIAIAQKQKDIRIWRVAPYEIRKMAKTAEPLSAIHYGIAHRVARGGWPKKIQGCRFSLQKSYSVNLPVVAV